MTDTKHSKLPWRVDSYKLDSYSKTDDRFCLRSVPAEKKNYQSFVGNMKEEDAKLVAEAVNNLQQYKEALEQLANPDYKWSDDENKLSYDEWVSFVARNALKGAK